jgi:hypothetical protein
MLEHIYGGSSTKFICICGISFYVYRLSKTGSKIIGMEKYIKNQNMYSCLSGEHMRVSECIYISVYLEEYKKLKGNKKDKISKLKKFYTELFDKKFPEKFDGLDTIKTLEHAAGKYNIKFIFYTNEEKNQVVHVMYIKDIQKYTKLHSCPKCGYIPPGTNNGSYHKDLFL